MPEVEPCGLLIRALQLALARHLTTSRFSVYSKYSHKRVFLLAILPLLGLGVSVSVSAGLFVVFGVFFGLMASGC